MAKIKLILSEALVDGMDVKFKAPCDCTEVDGLTVNYPTDDDERASMNFTFRDAHGQSLTGIGNLFSRNAYVKAILNTTNKYAYLQNADNNSFLNSAIIRTYTHSSSGLSGSGVNGKFKATVSGTYSSISVNGSSCTVKCGEESSVELIEGCWYTFILDGSTVNFSTGGAGAKLNLTVVNSETEPASPKENTIWVSGKYGMGSWAISPTKPLRVSKSKNLIVYPFYETTHVEDGITFTDVGGDNKGWITANGTATAQSDFRFSYDSAESGMFILTPGTYTLSGCPAGGSTSTYALILNRINDSGAWANYRTETGSGNTFTIDRDTVCNVVFRVFAGATVSNLTVKPQLERGSTATSFTMGNATGQVWIKTDSTSELSLTAVKKNAIIVQPREAYEYSTGSGWVKREMKVYQYGAWREANTSFYIYDKGSSTGYSWKCDETMRQLSAGHTGEADRVTVGSSSITVTTSATRAYDFTNIFVTNSSNSFVKIDLSKYTKVRIKGTLSGASGNNDCVFRVLSEMGTLCTENNVASKSFTSGTIDATIDISAINSSCFLGFTVYNDTTTPVSITFKLTELWLE